MCARQRGRKQMNNGLKHGPHKSAGHELKCAVLITALHVEGELRLLSDREEEIIVFV